MISGGGRVGGPPRGGRPDARHANQRHKATSRAKTYIARQVLWHASPLPPAILSRAMSILRAAKAPRDLARGVGDGRGQVHQARGVDARAEADDGEGGQGAGRGGADGRAGGADTVQVLLV